MSTADAPKRVLLVDDEAHILHVVALKLRSAGFDVHTASDGEEGLDAAIDLQPDLIITDYQMPFMTGLELAQQLKVEGVTASIPVIMLTARGFSLAPDEIAKTNVVAVLSKPFSPREVLAKAQELAAGPVNAR